VDYDSIEGKIRLYVSQIGQRIKLSLNERLAPYGLTPQQARIIGFVISEQREGKVICQKDIEEAFGLKGSSITSLLQGLERKSFVVRHSDPTDERKKVVTVLAKGQALMRDAEAAFHEIDQKIVRGLTQEQQEMLVHLLEHMDHNLV
jgi:DNA-binding MarR family transcriptional regulator